MKLKTVFIVFTIILLGSYSTSLLTTSDDLFDRLFNGFILFITMIVGYDTYSKKKKN